MKYCNVNIICRAIIWVLGIIHYIMYILFYNNMQKFKVIANMI